MILDEESLLDPLIMHAEALLRMDLIGINDEARIKFENKELLCSDNGRFVKVPDEVQKEIDKYEKEFKNLIYHVVHGDLYGYDVYNCLSVSPYLEDWDFERKLTQRCNPFAYCINLTVSDYCESGTIFLENKDGFLYRVT